MRKIVVALIAVAALVATAVPSQADGFRHGPGRFEGGHHFQGRGFIGHRPFVRHHFFVGPRVFFGAPLVIAPPVVYPRPYAYAPAVVVPEPPVYIQPQQYWYYCPDFQAYYPSVQQCPSGWLQVAPQPQ